MKSVRWQVAWAAALLMLLWALPAAASAPAFDRIEAVRADWSAQQPPDTGWTEATLPDAWTTRWPGFDGVVWYRLTWSQASTDAPLGLLLDYLSMAGAVSLNGSLLGRDPQLVEPLTRARSIPRYWLLSAPTLRAGPNTLLVRVSGLAAYRPGLGPVRLGDPAQLQAAYEALQQSRDQQVFNLAMTLTLWGFFLVLWLMRRQEVVHGWFSLMAGVWWWQIFLQNYTTSPWPFADTYAWHRGVITLFLLHNALFLVFMLRFCEQRWRRLERALWLAVAAGVALIAWVPVAQIASVQQLISWSVCFTFFGACFLLLRHTWYSRRTDHRILSLVMSVSIVAGVHDILLLAGWVNSDIHYTVYTSQLEMLGMALVLAWRFAASLGRIERFSDELAAKVAAAREELALTLQRQHTLEVANARLTERNSLAHDLHDGLGGTLVSSIAAMEHAEGGVPAARFLGILKELRDELRITVDIGASQQLGDHALGELLAPPRHRLTRLCEGQRIACHWHIDDAAAQRSVRAAQGLDLVRVLQEAVTNVLKHSGASRVDIDIRQDAANLVLTVTDNGVGFDANADPAHSGTGLHSLRLRAQRLDGRLSLASRPGQTVVALCMPWPASALAP